MIVELNREEALNIMMSNETGKFIYVLRNDYWRRRDKINEETD